MFPAYCYSSLTLGINLDKLWPDTRYEVMVQSYNIFGWSQESEVLYVITPKSGRQYLFVTFRGHGIMKNTPTPPLQYAFILSTTSVGLGLGTV